MKRLTTLLLISLTLLAMSACGGEDPSRDNGCTGTTTEQCTTPTENSNINGSNDDSNGLNAPAKGMVVGPGDDLGGGPGTGGNGGDDDDDGDDCPNNECGTNTKQPPSSNK